MSLSAATHQKKREELIRKLGLEGYFSALRRGHHIASSDDTRSYYKGKLEAARHILDVIVKRGDYDPL